MKQELFNDGSHACLVFRDLVGDPAIQANQYLVIDNDHAALVDPGGEPCYTRLFMAVGGRIDLKKLDYVVVSHPDPDAAASLYKWLMATQCRVVVPALWEHSVAHLARPGKLVDRMLAIPDTGANLPLGRTRLQALPAHFLHSAGGLCLYDPVSRLLFSGDIGANFPPEGLDEPVTKLRKILPYMEGFHRRHMGSHRVCRLWVNMIRTLELEAIVPQHGRALVGRRAVLEFLKWLEHLECGVDLMTQDSYRVPGAVA